MYEGRGAPKSANLRCRSGQHSPPANVISKDLQRLELSYIELNKERAKQKEWKKLIRDMVFQRGKIPLLLAVEAGNQSMVRELLSAQTAEQLKVFEISTYRFQKEWHMSFVFIQCYVIGFVEDVERLFSNCFEYFWTFKNVNLLMIENLY